jgi:integrase
MNTSAKRSQKKQKKNPPCEVDSFYIMEGDVKIYKRRDGGDQWWFKWYSAIDKKNIRRSLKTKNKEFSIERGKKLYIEMTSKALTGERIIDMSVGNLTKKFIQYQETQCEANRITRERLKSLSSFLNTVGDFLGRAIRISSIPRMKFVEKYETFRKERSERQISDSTLVGELQAWKQCITWGKDRGIISSTIHLVYPQFRDYKKRRDTFTREEYRSITRFLRTKKWLDCSHSYHSSRHLLLRYAFLVLSNTGMRIGELLKVKYKHIGEPYNYQDENTNEWKETVEIHIPRENSKTKKLRQVVCFGDTLKWLKKVREISSFNSSNDFIFSNPRGNEWQLSERMFNKIMEGAGVDRENRSGSLTWYSCRHFYATCRVEEGVDIYLLSKQMGTSVQMIERHYGHLKVKSRTAELNKWGKRRVQN